ncbi:MAG: hypothetical protein LBR28_00460 [Bacteroidales bacterium]|jgi:gliding motility-associated lipoprotein GldD|nr:hypothetical protein [Bacteroidales bacterium]
MKKTLSIILICSICLFWSCIKEDRYQPKPKTYVRIDIPQYEYIVFDTATLPFTFEYPNYGKIVPNSYENNLNWFNIDFQPYGYTLYVTYIHFNNLSFLDSLISDCDKFAYESQNKRSSGVLSKTYNNEYANVFATTYQIKGNKVASPYQFFITDKNNNFIRASLNYNKPANNDSLAPVIKHIEADLEHLISSFRWK